MAKKTTEKQNINIGNVRSLSFGLQDETVTWTLSICNKQDEWTSG